MSAVQTVGSAETTTLSQGLGVSTNENTVLNLEPESDTLASSDTGELTNATHVTIQLSDGMESSTLSQQKLQELILQLSQSGQIQLREDSKIVIDLKFSGKSDEDSEKPEQQVPVTNSAVSPAPITIAGSSSSKCDSSSTASFTTRSQQPTYIIVPAGQLSGSSESQLYPGSSQVRTVASGGAVARPVSGAVSGAGTFGSQDRSFILVQQPLSTSNTTASASNSVVIGNSGTTTLVPLRQVSAVTAGVNRLTANTTWVTAGSNRFVATGAPTELYINNGSAVNIGTRAGHPSYVTLSSGSNAAGVSRESSWQQYVKQFAKLGPCPICGDRISGYHYGIFCCESCKGFFKRTVQNAKRYICHHPNSNTVCEVNVSSRKKCPACRFLKCVDKGMRIEAIRSDRTRGGRSMYPGSRYLRQMAARVSTGRSSCVSDLNSSDPNSVLLGRYGKLDPEGTLVGLQHPLGPDGLPSSVDAGGGVYLDPAVLGTQADDDDENDQNAMQLDQSLLEYPGSSSCATPIIGRQVIVSGTTSNAVRTRIELPKVLSDIVTVEESIEAEPEDTLEIDAGSAPNGTNIPEGVTEDEAAVYRALLNLADQRLYRTVRWSRALPDFAQLDTDDQILLLQNCWADLLCLDCCWRSLPTPTEIRLTSSKCINLEAARELGAEEIVERMLQLTQYLTQLQPDLVEYACLKVIVLMQPDLKNLKAADHVRQYQESVRRMLMDYVANSSGKRDKFTQLIAAIPELQHTSNTARIMLVDLDLSAYLSNNSLLMELLRSDIQRFTSADKTKIESNSAEHDDIKDESKDTKPTPASSDSTTSGHVNEGAAAAGKKSPTTSESREIPSHTTEAFSDGDLVQEVAEVMTESTPSQQA